MDTAFSFGTKSIVKLNRSQYLECAKNSLEFRGFINHQKLTEIVEAAAQKEATMGKDGAPHHLAELELLARAQKDWYYAMMSYIMGGDSDAEEESKWLRF